MSKSRKRAKPVSPPPRGRRTWRWAAVLIAAGATAFALSITRSERASLPASRATPATPTFLPTVTNPAAPSDPTPEGMAGFPAANSPWARRTRRRTPRLVSA